MPPETDKTKDIKFYIVGTDQYGNEKRKELNVSGARVVTVDDIGDVPIHDSMIHVPQVSVSGKMNRRDYLRLKTTMLFCGLKALIKEMIK